MNTQNKIQDADVPDSKNTRTLKDFVDLLKKTWLDEFAIAAAIATIIGVIVTILIPSITFYANSYIESRLLRTVVNEIKNAEMNIDSNITNQYKALSHARRAKLCLSKISNFTQYYKSEEYNYCYAKVLIFEGALLMNAKENDIAEQLFLESYSYADSLVKSDLLKSNTLKASIEFNLGEISLRKKEKSLAIEYFQNAYNYSDMDGEPIIDKAVFEDVLKEYSDFEEISQKLTFSKSQ